MKVRHLKRRQGFSASTLGLGARSSRQRSTNARVRIRGKHTLAEMIGYCDVKARRPADLAAWDACAPVGREVL